MGNKTKFYKYSARLSIIAPIIALVISHFILPEMVHPLSTKAISYFIFSLYVIGFIAALTALFGIPNQGRKGILGFSIAGLLINGTIISLAFTLLPTLSMVKNRKKMSERDMLSMPDIIQNSVRIIDTDIGFRFELPEGFEKFMQEHNRERFIHSYANFSLENDNYFLVTVQNLGGIITREKISDDDLEKISSILPEGTVIRRFQIEWKGYELEGFSMKMSNGEEIISVSNVQVPLAMSAIQINVAGPEREEEQCMELLKQILESLRGKSNWDYIEK